MSTGKPKPLITSVAALRVLVTGLTVFSLGGMTAYAADHVRNSAAPLQPAAVPTPAVVTTTTGTTTGRIQLSVGVPTTTARPVTTTHRS